MVILNKKNNGFFVMFLLLISLLLFSNFVLAAPSFVSPTQGQVFNLVEDILFTANITTIDGDGYYPINITDNSHDPVVGFDCFSKLIYNDRIATMNFTPTNDYVGEYNVELIAKNSNNEPYVISVMFNVSDSNDYPTLFLVNPIASATVSENSTLVLEVTASDIDLPYGDNLTFTWLLDNATSSKLNGTKQTSIFSNATYSPDFFDYNITAHKATVVINDDRDGNVNYTWDITVENVNRKPINNATIMNITWDEDINLTNNLSLRYFFHDPDVNESLCERDTGNCLDFGYLVVGGNASGIIFDINDTSSNVSFYPTENWHGQLNITYTASDSIDTNISNLVVLNVNPVNDAPDIVSVAGLNTYAHTSFGYQINASDVDYDSLTYYISSPTLNDITISSTGQIQLVSNDSHVGSHEVNVSVDDGVINSSINFTFIVNANSIPQIIPFSNIYVQQYDSHDLPINATDADLDSMEIWVNSSIFYSQSYNTTSHNFSIVPPVEQEYIGNVSVRAFVNDTHGAQSYYDFIVEVIDKPMSPFLYNVSVTNNQIKANETIIIDVYAFDEDGNIKGFYDNSSMFNISSLSNGTIFENATARYTLTPSLIGYHEINITVNDTHNHENSTLLILNITNNNLPTFTSLTDILCEENEPCVQLVIAEDLDWQDNDDLLYGDNATDFNINPVNGLINFFPPVEEYYDALIWVYDGTSNITQTIFVNITEINDPPLFSENLSRLSIWNASIENSTTLFNITATDEENDTLSMAVNFINFTSQVGAVSTSGINLFNLSNLVINSSNHTNGLVNFTPDSTDVGLYWVNISVTDGELTTWESFSFIISNINDNPIVDWTLTYPYYSLVLVGNETDSYNVVDVIENTSLTIHTTPDDLDYDDINVSWYLINSNNDSYFLSYADDISHDISFVANPNETLFMSVYDGRNYTNISWMLNVTNVNRPVIFGNYEYDFNSSLGTFNNSHEVSQNYYITSNWSGGYMDTSYFISNTLDFYTTSFDIPRISYETINASISAPNGSYSITYQTASANVYADVLTTWINAPGGIINSDDYRYLAFRFDVNNSNTSNTPEIDFVTISYEISDLSVGANVEYAAWIDLNHFFHDPDDNDVLTYDYEFLEGSTLMNVSFVQDHYVGLQFNSAGDVQLRFNATDGHGGNARSNVINITISTNDQSSSSSSTSSSSSSSTSTSYQTRVETETVYEYKRKDEPVALDIIHPGAVTIYKEGLVEIPISLKNNDKFDFTDIIIAAETDNENIPVKIDITEIPRLARNAEQELMLTMNLTEVYDSYSVYVNVSMGDPDFSDSAKIVISSLKKASDSPEAQLMKLSFVSDFLSKNEDCLELSEYIDRAKTHLDANEYDKAGQLLDEFMNDCKVLIKAIEAEENKPADTLLGQTIARFQTDSNFFSVGIILMAAVLMSVVVAIVSIYKKI